MSWLLRSVIINQADDLSSSYTTHSNRIIYDELQRLVNTVKDRIHRGIENYNTYADLI